MKNKNKRLEEFIKKVIARCLDETGPSAQGLVQPWLGPSLKDDEGVPKRGVCDNDSCDPDDTKTPPNSFNRS